MTAGLPINPPTGPFVMRAELEARDVTFTDGLAYDAGFWFWVYADRPWAVGPYRQRQAAERARGIATCACPPALRAGCGTPSRTLVVHIGNMHYRC